MQPDEMPEIDSIRFTADNEVERFDGTAWQRYEELADDGSESLFRDGESGEPESGGGGSARDDEPDDGPGAPAAQA